MSIFQLRFDGADLHPKLIDWLDERADYWLLLRETVNGKNPHVQGFGFFNISRRTMTRDFFKTGLRHIYKGNDAYSIKPCCASSKTPDRNLILYTCKGDALGRYDKHYYKKCHPDWEFSKKDVDDANIEYWQNRENFKEKVKKSKLNNPICLQIIKSDLWSPDYTNGNPQDRLEFEMAQRLVLAYYYSRIKSFPSKWVLFGISMMLTAWSLNEGNYVIDPMSSTVQDMLDLYKNI